MEYVICELIPVYKMVCINIVVGKCNPECAYEKKIGNEKKKELLTKMLCKKNGMGNVKSFMFEKYKYKVIT